MKKQKVYKLNGGTYDFTALLLITPNYEDVNIVAREVFEEPSYDLKVWYPELDEEHGHKPRGLHLTRKNYQPIIWIPKKPKTPREHATLAHEILHLTGYIMYWVGLPFNQDTEEAWCHLNAHLTNQVYEYLK